MTDEGQVQEQQESSWDDEVKGRMRLFVINYCTETLCFFNGTAAYKAAYTDQRTGREPKDDVAAVSASRLLRNVKVQDAIHKLLEEMQPEVNLDGAYRILHAAKIIATTNPADIIDKEGRLVAKRLADLGDKAYCIAQVYHDKSGHVCYQLEDRSKYMALLAKVYRLEALFEPAKKDNTGVVEVPAKTADPATATPKEIAEEWNRVHEEELGKPQEEEESR